MIGVFFILCEVLKHSIKLLYLRIPALRNDAFHLMAMPSQAVHDRSVMTCGHDRI